jgi:ferritin
MLALFNEQVTHELEASQLYLSASIWCDANDFPGMARFFLSESNDERGHALAMIEFANKRNIPVALSNLQAPDASWETPEDLWADILTSEMENTQALLKLGDEAAACRDHVTTAFLMPYHMEQVNAEDNLRTILAKVRDENKTPGLLRQLDSELGNQAKAHLTG